MHTSSTLCQRCPFRIILDSESVQRLTSSLTKGLPCASCPLLSGYKVAVEGAPRTGCSDSFQDVANAVSEAGQNLTGTLPTPIEHPTLRADNSVWSTGEATHG